LRGAPAGRAAHLKKTGWEGVVCLKPRAFCV